MMKALPLLLFLFILLLPTTDTPWRLARKAFHQDLDGVLDDAEVNYRRALKQRPDFYLATLNLGNILYRQGRITEALAQYQLLLNTSEAPAQLRAKAFYNAGTTYLRIGQLQESRHSLQEALRLNPEDAAARYNLSYVIKLMAGQDKSGQSAKKAGGEETSAEADEEGTSHGSKAKHEEAGDSDQGLQGKHQENMEQVLEALDLNERSASNKMKRNYNIGGKAKVEQDW